MSDYIVDEETRNKLDEARYSLALKSKESGNSEDRTLFGLALTTANFLSQAVLTLPGLTITEDGELVQDEDVPADDADALGSLLAGLNTEEAGAALEAALGGFGHGNAGGD